jgi:ribosome biogenesis GTPase
VVATAGRRVVVRDDEGERVCFLAGRRAVVGDRVRWVEARGEGGKLVSVEERERSLIRVDFKGRNQVVAANLGGLLVVASSAQPAYRPGLMDRYQVGAEVAGIPIAIVLTKVDLGVSDETEADLAMRAELGVPVMRVANPSGDGGQTVLDFLAEQAGTGPWALVGHSGVGKTSLAATLLPDVDVGPIGEISEYWEAGRHTTTGSRIYELPTGGEIADSPGIRTFLPSGLDPHAVRDHFPGLPPLACRYRDCLHRPGEDGCVAPESVSAATLMRYRRLLTEVSSLAERMRP